MITEIVHVRLLEEGSPTLRVAHAEPVTGKLYKLIADKQYDPEDEVWEFLPGSVVRVEQKLNGTEDILLAVELIEQPV